MKIQEVIDRIMAYHPSLGEREATTVDRVLCGDTSQELTGIVTTCCPSVAVIRKAIELGANLIIPHEPLFYKHEGDTDWLEGDPVYEEKKALLAAHNMVVFRDHDHIHRHRPDGIRYGVFQELGWTEYCTADMMAEDRQRLVIHLPEPLPLQDVVNHLKKTLEIETTRVIGNPDTVVSNILFSGHAHFTNGVESVKALMADDVDVLIPGELIDWTVANYARDAAQLGKNKAIIHLGHFNSEELGMRYAAKWVGELIDHEVPVTPVNSADIYMYM